MQATDKINSASVFVPHLTSIVEMLDLHQQHSQSRIDVFWLKLCIKEEYIEKAIFFAVSEYYIISINKISMWYEKNHYNFSTNRNRLLVSKIMYSRRKDTTRITWCISSQKKGIELLQTYFRYRWSILISVISELIGYV